MTTRQLLDLHLFWSETTSFVKTRAVVRAFSVETREAFEHFGCGDDYARLLVLIEEAPARPNRQLQAFLDAIAKDCCERFDKALDALSAEQEGWTVN